MGTHISKSSFSSFSNDLDYVQSFFSTDLGGEVRFLRHRTTNTPVISRYFNSMVINIGRRLNFDSPHLMKFYGSDPDPRDGIEKEFAHKQNSTPYVLYLEYLPLSLSDILTKRLQRAAFFPEDELRQLLDGVISALGYLQDQKVWHTCLCPESIFYEESTGIYKIYDNEVIQGARNAGPQLFVQKKKNYYFSPEVLDSIVKGDYVNLNRVDPYKADVFSLGMVLLEAATLRSSADLYNFSSVFIYEDELKNRIRSLAQNYSIEFCNILNKMLDFSPEKRFDSKQLNAFLYVKQMHTESNNNFLKSKMLMEANQFQIDPLAKYSDSNLNKYIPMPYTVDHSSAENNARISLKIKSPYKRKEPKTGERLPRNSSGKKLFDRQRSNSPIFQNAPLDAIYNQPPFDNTNIRMNYSFLPPNQSGIINSRGVVMPPMAFQPEMIIIPSPNYIRVNEGPIISSSQMLTPKFVIQRENIINNVIPYQQHKF